MYRRTDDEINHDVGRELSWDTRTWNEKIHVKVFNGVVTLNGIVHSYAQKHAAEEAAHRVTGVTDVANDIIVRIKRPKSDSTVAEMVRQALKADAFLPDWKITSTVSGGWVKLEGQVISLTERARAERLVENVGGVAGVINELEVERFKTDPLTLRATIEKALERRADREAERIRVKVVDGEVNLFGRVHSWFERRAVVGSISHARGVEKINDHLTVDPYF